MKNVQPPAAKLPATDNTCWPTTFSRNDLSMGMPNTNIRQVSSTSGRVRVKLTGQHCCNILKAGAKDNSPSCIFCASNIGMNYNVRTIVYSAKTLVCPFVFVLMRRHQAIQGVLLSLLFLLMTANWMKMKVA